MTQLSDPTQFANIILRSNPTAASRGSATWRAWNSARKTTSRALRFDGHSRVVGLACSNTLPPTRFDVSRAVTAQMDQLSKAVPAGRALYGRIQHHDFVRESIKEVLLTLLLSIVLVVRVILHLLAESASSTLIPAATIPVSLVGTFFVMKIFGFSINTITLFGLTLATGLVVDDAIVVIENIARHIEMNKGKKNAIASAAEAMREIQSAVVASSLVLLAVFIPVGFFPGTTGQLYKQFALTIAAAIIDLALPSADAGAGAVGALSER